MKTPRFFWRQFPKFMENKYFVWHAVDTRPLLPSITVQRTIKLIRIVLGFWAPICIKLGKGTLFSSKMITSFHTVLFLQKIGKILKLFCHFWWRMRVQVDRPKGLNSQDLFPLGIKNEKKILRALLCVKDKQTDEQNWIHRIFFFGGPKEFTIGLNHQKLFKIKQMPQASASVQLSFCITLQDSNTEGLRPIYRTDSNKFPIIDIYGHWLCCIFGSCMTEESCWELMV